MEDLGIDVIDNAEKGEFSDFASKVKDVLAQKVQDHPFIQAKKEEYLRNSRIKDTFAEIDDNYLDTDDISSEE